MTLFVPTLELQWVVHLHATMNAFPDRLGRESAARLVSRLLWFVRSGGGRGERWESVVLALALGVIYRSGGEHRHELRHLMLEGLLGGGLSS